MEIFQTIWTALNTQNEMLITIALLLLTFLDSTLLMLLSTTILNISTTKKQRITFVLFISILFDAFILFIPNNYRVFLNIIILPLTVFIIFKTSALKSISFVLLPAVLTALLDTIIAKIYLIIFNINLNVVSIIPIYRISSALFIYFILYLTYRLAKHFNFNILLLDNFSKKNKYILLFNSFAAFIAIATQFYLIGYYNDILPLSITLLSLLSLITYFFISIYSLSKTTELQLAEQNLEEAQLYNKSLKILHDNVRAFKHDFSNIVQAIGGYVGTDDMDGLKIYYSQLLEDCQKVNNLYTLSPDVINNPAIYSILAAKYHRADELGIKIHLEVFLNLNELHMKIYEFTRILGILMDNAIEASKECDKKEINVELRKDFNVNRQLLIIQNTYKEKDVDLDRIFEKGFSSKPNNTGLGLWEVRQILKKNSNLNLYTNKDDKYFLQQLEIY